MFHMFTNKMMLDIDVFCIKVVNRTISECNTSLVVGINNGCRNLRIIEFSKKKSKLYSLLHSI